MTIKQQDDQRELELRVLIHNFGVPIKPNNTMTTNKITTSPVFRKFLRFGSIFTATLLLVFMVSSFKVKGEKHNPTKPLMAYYTEFYFSTGFPCAPSNIDYDIWVGGTSTYTGTWCGATTTFSGVPSDIYFGPAGSPYTAHLTAPFPGSAPGLSVSCVNCVSFTACTPICTPIPTDILYQAYTYSSGGGTNNVTRVDLR